MTEKKELNQRLINAAKAGDVEAVKKALADGAEINFKDDSGGGTGPGNTALAWAVYNKHTDVLKALIDNKGEKPDLNFESFMNTSLLAAAAQQGNQEAVRILLDAGANPDVKERGRTTTPLILAIQYDHLELAKMLLANPQIKIDVQDQFGDTAILKAVNNRSPELVKELIDAKANLDIKNNDGNTALMMAFKKRGFGEAVRQLVDAKPNPDIQDKDGNTVLLLTIEYYPDLAYKLISAKTGLDIKNNTGQTALLSAAAHGYKGIVKSLIDAGANVNAQDENGHTALMEAAAHSVSGEAIEVMISAGADIHAKDKDGNTPLVYAISHRNFEAIKLFISTEPDIIKFAGENSEPLLSTMAFTAERGSGENFIKNKKGLQVYYDVCDVISNSLNKTDSKDFENTIPAIIQLTNHLHEASNEERFRIIDKLTPEKCLAVIGGDKNGQMYNSTFEELFNNVIKKSADVGKLIEDSDIGLNFAKQVAAHGKGNALFEKLGVAASEKLVDRLIDNINKNKQPEDAIALANLGNCKNKDIRKYVEDKIIENFKKNNPDIEATSLYGVTASLYNNKAGADISVGNKDFFHKISTSSYKMVPMDKKTIGELTEKKDGHRLYTDIHKFYNDEDGKNSYDDFMRLFKDDKKWKIEDKGDYSIVHSIGAKVEMNLYVTHPEAEGKKPVDQIKEYLKENGNPKIGLFAHRGHSTHTAASIPDISAEAGVIFIGACSGYGYLSKAHDQAQDAHIIATQNTGTMVINNKIFEGIYSDVREGKDLVWKDIWKPIDKIWKDAKHKIDEHDKQVEAWNKKGRPGKPPPPIDKIDELAAKGEFYVEPDKNGDFQFVATYEKIIKMYKNISSHGVKPSNPDVPTIAPSQEPGQNQR